MRDIRAPLDRHKDSIALDAHGIEPQPARVCERLARQQIELPAVPGTGQNLAFAPPAELPDRRRHGGAAETAETDRRQLMRADIQHGNDPPVDVEETDR